MIGDPPCVGLWAETSGAINVHLALRAARGGPGGPRRVSHRHDVLLTDAGKLHRALRTGCPLLPRAMQQGDWKACLSIKWEP